MTTTSFPFALPGFDIDRVEQVEGHLTIFARAIGPEAACPACNQRSTRVHSYYMRSPGDLPISDQSVRLCLRVRRFRCMSPRCPQRIFAERLPDVLPSHAQRTERLTETFRVVGFALGGEAGARVLSLLRMPTSGDTLLRTLRREPFGSALPPPVRVVGVDDWAFCKGRRYGTVLVDLERHRPIDLLADRKAETLAEWLRAHPGIEIVARDRSTEYARGITEGAPGALQVADRWHLLKNLREALERDLRQSHTRLAALPDVTCRKETTSSRAVHLQGRRGPFWRSQAEEDASQASRARRLAIYEKVHQMRSAGRSIRQIAQELGMSRGGVRPYFYAKVFPERAQRQEAKSILDPYLDYLEMRHQEGCENALALWREIKERGYPGTHRQVSKWMQLRRRKPAATAPTKDWPAGYIRQKASTMAKRASLPSPKKLSWLMVREPESLTEKDKELLNRLLQEPKAETIYRLAQRFVRMVRERLPANLNAWIAACLRSGVKSFENFAASIRQDYLAVKAALETAWSSGQAEGQINRLKLLKRQMYGRAGFDLLRLRVLHTN